MPRLRAANPLLEGLVPYDPKYLPATAMLSANENPCDVPAPVRARIQRAVEDVALNRYPDPLANQLRDELADVYGLSRENVLVGNGGDELLFDVLLAWGGTGRVLLNLPPTFSVYAANARLTGTNVVDVMRRDDFSIDEEAVLARVAQGGIDIVVVCSPNNPTGDLARAGFLQRLLESTDALVLLYEAYGEFAGQSALPLLERYENLAILHTFSKAYSLAGVRVGFLLSSSTVVSELCKVRQPYSVDAVSQAIALEVVRGRASFAAGIERIVAERERLFDAMSGLPGVHVYPSAANYLFFRVPGEVAASLWQACYDAGVLIRDFSAGELTRDCFRVTAGTPEENDMFLEVLRKACS